MYASSSMSQLAHLRLLPSSPPFGGNNAWRPPAAKLKENASRRANEQEQDVERSETDRVKIFDTTLRDGEQSPGISLNKQEKLEIAHQLARLGVDVIEAGFPITSPGDFEAVQAIAREVHGPVICGLARTGCRTSTPPGTPSRTPSARASTPSSPRATSTSSASSRRPARTSRARRAPRSRSARSTTDDVEFSPEDGSRSDLEFMAEVLQIAIDEGATTINVPDTVGYTMPEEYAEMFARSTELCPTWTTVTISVHCHNDLGLAVANSFAGRQAGCAPGRVRRSTASASGPATPRSRRS